MGRALACVGDRIAAYTVLVGTHGGKRPLGKRKRSWKNNIKMDLQQVGKGLWTGLIWLRVGTGDGLL